MRLRNWQEDLAVSVLLRSSRASCAETFFGLAGRRRKPFPHRGSFFNTWRSLNRSRLKQGFFCNWSLTSFQSVGPLRFGFTFFGGDCLSTLFFWRSGSGASVCETWRVELSEEGSSVQQRSLPRFRHNWCRKPGPRS